MLSFLSDHSTTGTFVPGINDLIEGNPEQGIMSAYEKCAGGTKPKKALADLREKEKRLSGIRTGVEEILRSAVEKKSIFSYFGIRVLLRQRPADNGKERAKARAERTLTFYSFRLMVGLGMFFLALFALSLFSYRDKLEGKRWFYYAAVAAIPLVYVSSMCGWIVTEVGRQPWVIQDLMPTVSAVSQVSATAVQTTFWIFAATFTVLLIAELKIMFSQIKKGIN